MHDLMFWRIRWCDSRARVRWGLYCLQITPDSINHACTVLQQEYLGVAALFGQMLAGTNCLDSSAPFKKSTRRELTSLCFCSDVLC